MTKILIAAIPISTSTNNIIHSFYYHTTTRKFSYKYVNNKIPEALQVGLSLIRSYCEVETEEYLKKDADLLNFFGEKAFRRFITFTKARKDISDESKNEILHEMLKNFSSSFEIISKKTEPIEIKDNSFVKSDVDLCESIPEDTERSLAGTVDEDI